MIAVYTADDYMNCYMKKIFLFVLDAWSVQKVWL